MQTSHFEKLDLDSRIRITWKQGVLLGHRSEGKNYMSLYRLYHFYVEIHYHSCFDGIASLRTFVCEEELQPYLCQIDISALL